MAASVEVDAAVRAHVDGLFAASFRSHPQARAGEAAVRLRVASACQVVINAVQKFGYEMRASGEMQHMQLTLGSFGCVSVSWNGGKDATVLLHIVRMALSIRQQIEREEKEEKKEQNEKKVRGREAEAEAEAERKGREEEEEWRPMAGMQAVALLGAADFPAIVQFTKEQADGAGLQLDVIVAGDMRQDITAYVARRSAVAAIFMGVRSCDPHCGTLGYMADSDTHRGWPAFVRVNPIIDWSYDEVWAFLLGFSLPFCSLYREGYTSIGSMQRTAKNACLRVGEDEEVDYLPAWMLTDPTQERAGRS